MFYDKTVSIWLMNGLFDLGKDLVRNVVFWCSFYGVWSDCCARLF